MIEQPEKRRLSFSKHNPFLQVAWDSTSLGAFKECARKYALNIVSGYVPKHTSLHLRWGALYHRALEVYDHKRFEGLDHTAAQIYMLRDLAEGCMDEELVEPGLDQLLDKPANTVFLSEKRRVWWNPNEFLSEEKAEKNTKTVQNLFRTVIWYTEHFINDPIQTVRLANGKPAVELSFRFELGKTNQFGEQLLYCGHLDRLVSDQSGSLWVVDRKTTSTTIAFGFFDQYSPDNQMSGYTVGGRVTLGASPKGVIIDAAQVGKTFSRFARGYANRTPAQLDEWLKTTLFNINVLAPLFASQAAEGLGVFAYPMNDKSCHKYNGCEFRKICQLDPRVQKAFLDSNFNIRKWDPLEVRGDI